VPTRSGPWLGVGRSHLVESCLKLEAGQARLALVSSLSLGQRREDEMVSFVDTEEAAY
jgi:hypothetical protein